MKSVKIVVILSLLGALFFAVGCKKKNPNQSAPVTPLSKLSENIYSYDLGKGVSVISTFDITGGLDTDNELIPSQSKGVCDGDNNVFLVKINDEIVLVDSGYGDKNPNAQLIKNISAIGIKPEDIKKIIMTHMHPDHVGGLTAGPSFFGATPKKVYPNAKIYVNKAEYDFWMQDTLAEGEASNLYYINPGFLPKDTDTFFAFGSSLVKDMNAVYGSDIVTFDNATSTDSIADLKEVSRVVLAGHTPGHTGYLIKGAKSLFIAGDFVNCAAVQLDDTAVGAIYDYNAEAASASRVTAIKYVMDNDLVVAGTHLPKPGFSKIENAETSGKYKLSAVK